jgi:predicted acyl esterase
MQGYQRLIRAEIFRGKFRESYKNPVPFKPGQKTLVTIPLQDIFHTFKPGHKMMIQVQSTWFPLFDINPQSFVNIYTAEAEDFRKAEHRVYTSGRFSSALRMKRMKK